MREALDIQTNFNEIDQAIRSFHSQHPGRTCYIILSQETLDIITKDKNITNFTRVHLSSNVATIFGAAVAVSNTMPFGMFEIR